MTCGSPATGYSRVYALEDDRTRIEHVQRATMDTADFGFALDHGLFGSPQWWKAIRDGELPLHVVRGTISDVAMGGMNDWPMFKIRQDDASETDFLQRYGPADKDALYKVGKGVIWKYVITRFKAPLPALREYVETTIEIWIEN